METIFEKEDKARLPEENIFGESIEEKTILRDRFVEPPFTVLNANGGEWLKRKRAWGRLGIKSELGRDGFDTYGSSITKLKAKLDGPNVKVEGGAYEKKRNRKEMSNISIFDPVVCELMYRWFAPEGGHILDPFSGGSVRGVVARYLGYEYCGIDLSAKQIDANRINAQEIFGDDPKPNWFIGDSESVLASSPNGGLFDLVFSCPPYADLEVYSQDVKDLSNMTYEQFVVKYRAIISQAVRLLKRGGYAVFVVGEVRDKRRNGAYYNFVGDTVSAFIDAGADYYNEAILVTAFGTAMLRTRAFTVARKMVKVHQNILVFRKP
jgi:SAM-dependent methyltransferase